MQFVGLNTRTYFRVQKEHMQMTRVEKEHVTVRKCLYLDWLRFQILLL